MKKIVLIFYLISNCTVNFAQVLPNLEQQIYQNDFTRSPKLYVWENPDETLVYATIIIQMAEEDYLLYGSRLTQVIKELWDDSVPLRSLMDVAGKQTINRYDSLLKVLLELDTTTNYLKKTVLNEYLLQQSVIKSRVQSVKANLMIGRRLFVKEAIPLEQAIMIRVVFDKVGLDKFIDYLYEKIHQPFWLEAYQWTKKLREGYPIIHSDRVLLSFPIETSVESFWIRFVKNAEISVAIVGDVNGNETITLSNLYWSNWLKETKSAYGNWNNRLMDNSLTIPIPTDYQFAIRNWIAHHFNYSYKEKCNFFTTSVPFLTKEQISGPMEMNVAEVHKRWMNFMLTSLNRADRAADLFAIAAINGGWEKWYEMDDQFLHYETTADYHWIKELITRNKK